MVAEHFVNSASAPAKRRFVAPRRTAPVFKGRIVAPVIVALLVIGCRPPREVSTTTESGSSGSNSATSAIRFTEVAGELGLHFSYRNAEEAERYAILESMGGGVGLLDFDQDGWLDAWLPGGGHYAGERELAGWPNGLFRSRSGTHFDDIASLANAEQSRRYSHGVAIADIDHDGFPDVLVTGYGGAQFFQNAGDGTFTERAEAMGLTDSLWSTSAAWGDLNGDHHLDLYITHYVDWSFDNDPACKARPPHDRDVCPPRKFGPLPDVIYFSNGDGTFRDATAETGLRPDGKGIGVVMVDVDGDNDLDVYVANDTVENFLYLNDGHGKLQDVSVSSGAAYNERGLPDGSMGVDIGDFDGDGAPDLLVTNYEGENAALYRNLGDGTFRHVSQMQGLAALGSMFVGWGVRLADFDNDGDNDVVISNGHAIRYPAESGLAQLPLLLENRGTQFESVGREVGGYFAQPHRGRGLAAGDLNGDGKLDVVFSNVNEPVACLRNDTPGDDYLRVRLIGSESNRDGIGARVELKSRERTQSAQVIGGGSYASSSEKTVHFGVEHGSQSLELKVHWPSGREQRVAVIGTNREVIVIEDVETR